MNNGKIKKEYCSFFLLVLYLIILVYITLFSRVVDFTRPCKTELFWSYIAWFAGRKHHGIQILSNLVLFLPFGFFLAGVFCGCNNSYNNNAEHDRKTLWLPLLICFVTSVAIEIIQYHFGLGVLDVDDVINNVLGGLAGAYIYRLCVLHGTAVTVKRKQDVLSAVFIIAGLIGCMMVSSAQTYLPVKRLGYAFRDVYLKAISIYAGPEVKNTDLETVVNKGMLKAHESNYDVYVYQYDHKLFWLIGTPIDKKTEMIFHLFTDEPDKLPAHRIKYKYDSRGFSAWAKNEITNTITSGKYRVYVREIPVEYHITEVRVGFNKGDKMIWMQYFMLSE